jgi:hypothetical protein
MYYGGAANVPGAPGNPGFFPSVGYSPLIAGGPSFDIPQGQGPLGKRSGEQLQRLYQGGTQQNQQLNEELIKRGLMPGAGPQLPLVQGLPGMAPMGNAGFYAGPQLGQAVPAGFQNKIVS